MKKKAEASNGIFASVFNDTDRSWAAQYPEYEDDHCVNSDFPSVDIEIVRDKLYQLNVYKSMGHGGIYPSILKELADIMPGSLSTIYQRTWKSGEVPTDWMLL